MLIIKGAIYTDGESLYRAAVTGDFWAVDCLEYLPKNEILDRYNEKWFAENADDFLTYKGEKFYRGEVSPQNTDGLELLSDLSGLKFFDETREF